MQDRKKEVAAIAAVMEYLCCRGEHPRRPAAKPPTQWRLSGRLALMQQRFQTQAGIVFGRRLR